MGGDPKRHHWWPQLQSGYWTDENNLMYVTREDGSYFRAQPKDLGVVGHLYSIQLADGKKDVEIEKWLATEIDSPFVGIIPHLHEKSKRKSLSLRGNLSRLDSLKNLGYKTRERIDFIGISLDQRRIISNYLAAFLIRSPQYLKKLVAFHEAENGAFEGVAKNLALKNMMHLFNVYSNRIMDSDFIAVEADGTHEFLFSDGGIVAREPWSDERGLPFDIHIPISPKLSIQVIPAPTQAWPNSIPVSYAANSATSIHNRIILAQAKSQVFSRSFPPVSFIKKNWGRTAPDFIAVRRNGNEIETKVDWSKFYH